MLNGRIGQVVGPFETNVDLLEVDGVIGKYTPGTRPILYKLGIQADQGTRVKINGVTIRIGKTGMYELDYTVSIRELMFIDDTTEDTLIDFVY